MTVTLDVGGLSAGAIAGIVVGSGALLALILAGAVITVIIHNRHKSVRIMPSQQSTIHSLPDLGADMVHIEQGGNARLDDQIIV